MGIQRPFIKASKTVDPWFGLGTNLGNIVTKYCFRNSISLPCPQPTLAEVLGNKEFGGTNWFGATSKLLAFAPSLGQLVVPWTFELPERIYPKTWKFVVEGFSVPVADILICRAQYSEDYKVGFGDWWLALCCNELSNIAYVFANAASWDDDFANNPEPICSALEEIHQVSREWLEKQEAARVNLVAVVSEPPMSVTELDLV